MKAIVASFAATIIIATVAWVVLDNMGFSSADVYSNSNVRLD